MKKIWLMGGFGNVLFQILAFNVISKNNDQVFYVKILTEKNLITKFLGWTIHERLYEDLINKYKIHEIGLLKSSIIILISFLSKKFNFKFKLSTFYSSSIQVENYTSNNIFGYFQDNSFLKKYQKELLDLGEMLRLKYSDKEKNSIVVHYRKGDSDWALKFLGYYNEIKKMLKKESLPILIVTDSVKDAISFFSSIDNVKILTSSNALDDFRYLLSANKLYCAPSTFSWWALHSLSINSEVIIPKIFKKHLGVFIRLKKITVI